MNPKTGQAKVNQLDQQLALPMFLVALAFLLIAGFLMHTTAEDLPRSFPYAEDIQQWGVIALVVLYLCIVAETIAHFVTGSDQMRQHVGYLLIPFLRLCPRDHVTGNCVWIVAIGWQETSPHFERYVGRLFSGPMILITLMVLPVVATHWWLESKGKFEPNTSLRFLIQTATGCIWMAFVYEFVVMIKVVERKLLYCKQNWIDIVVILLPLILFLRAARLGRLIKLQQLSRTAKMYRMRGLALRTWRAFVTLDVIDKILRRTPAYRYEKIRSQIMEKERELCRLKAELETARREADLFAVKNGSPNGSAAITRKTDELPMKFSYSKK
jgi:hypothetical protein